MQFGEAISQSGKSNSRKASVGLNFYKPAHNEMKVTKPRDAMSVAKSAMRLT